MAREIVSRRGATEALDDFVGELAVAGIGVEIRGDAIGDGRELTPKAVVGVEVFRQDYRIIKNDLGSAVCREADEPSALAEPVVSPLIHGIILHLASALFNCEFSQVLREFFSRESPRREGVFPGLRASLIAEKRLRPPLRCSSLISSFQGCPNAPRYLYCLP